MSRIPDLQLEDLTPEQRRIYDEITLRWCQARHRYG